MGEVQGWGSVCVCVAGISAQICVHPEWFVGEEGNEYWLRTNAHNLHIENVNGTAKHFVNAGFKMCGTK